MIHLSPQLCVNVVNSIYGIEQGCSIQARNRAFCSELVQHGNGFVERFDSSSMLQRLLRPGKRNIQMVTYIRLVAPKDPNGNPRRIFVIFRDGEMIATVDEGYMGTGALKKRWPDAISDGSSFQTTVKQYNELYKFQNLE